MSRAQRQAEFEKISQVPECPKWEYENPQGEAELIRRLKETEGSKNVTRLCTAR
jgi:hypothetical protein